MKSKTSQLTTLALYSLLLALTIVVALLARENRHLKDQLYSLSASAAGGLKVGHPLPQLETKALDGEDYLVRFGPQSDSWVLVFSTTCKACTDNLESWKDLFRQGRDRYEFVAISIDPLEQTRTYARENNLPFRVVTPKEPSFFDQMYGVEGVPLTIRVGPNGRVLESYPGILPMGYVSQALASVTGGADLAEAL
ncbi:MAG: redoxin domain-containing protein [Deltaproteobacteria bacterium]|nr:redoxin domain-containing protein [Deltaproteobacteria bacterium]